MSQAGQNSKTIIPPGTYIEQLRGDVLPAVGGALVSILGNGLAAPASLANSGLILTGSSPSTLNGTFNYVNMPDTTVGGFGITYLNTIRFMHNYSAGSSQNTFLGANSGNLTMTSSAVQNTGIGTGALGSITGVANSTAVGYHALTSATVQTNSTAVGSFALASSSGLGGGVNNAFGRLALSNLTTGLGNTAIGMGNSTANGAGDALTSNENYNICINNSGVAGVNNAIYIGNTQNLFIAGGKTYIQGIYGNPPPAGLPFSLTVSTGNNAQICTLPLPSNGQIPIGFGSPFGFTLNTITPGAGISIANGPGTITISSVGGGLSWSVITANQTAAINNGYFCNKAGTLALALPATSAVGDVIEVTNENTALGVQFTQAAGQQILIGNTNTTSGATGTLTSSAVGDTLKIVCKVANTIWRVTSSMGNWTPA